MKQNLMGFLYIEFSSLVLLLSYHTTMAKFQGFAISIMFPPWLWTQRVFWNGEAPLLQSELFLQDPMEAIVFTYPVSSFALKPLCLLWLSFSNGLSNQDSLPWKEPDEWAPHYLTRTRTHHVGSPFNNYVVGLELFFSTDPQYMDACVCHSIFHVTWASPFHQTKTERWRLSLYLDRDPMDDETKKRRWAGSGLDSDEPHLLATNKLSQASHVWHYMTCTHYILQRRELIWDWN